LVGTEKSKRRKRVMGVAGKEKNRRRGKKKRGGLNSKEKGGK